MSLFPSRGQIDLTASATTTFAASNTWTKLAGTTALDATLGQDGFAQSANNELQATKAVNQVLLCVANVELTCASNNKTFGVTLAKNGTAIGTFHVSQRQDDGGTPYSYNCTALIAVSQNDTLSVYARNESDTTSVTANNITLSAVGFIR